MSFLQKVKSVFRSNKGPIYKNYTPAELKVVAMKTRIVLEEYQKKSYTKIKEGDSQLYLYRTNPNSGYKIMKEIGHNIIQVQCIKIYIQILRKIEDKSGSIVQTNGDIALLKTQIKWFQSILWYRKCKNIDNINDFWNFSFNFFKGVDITAEINVKCEIFTMFPLLKYLNADVILPLEKIMDDLNNYIQTKIDDEVMKQIMKLNRQQIYDWQKRLKRSLSKQIKKDNTHTNPMMNSTMTNHQYNKLKAKSNQPFSLISHQNQNEIQKCQICNREQKCQLEGAIICLQCINKKKLSQIQKCRYCGKNYEKGMEEKNMCEECFAKEKLQKCRHCGKNYEKGMEEKNMCEECYWDECSIKMKKFSLKNEKEERWKEFNDEQESLQFMRGCIKAKKSRIKKPYMVSIYARAQYVNKLG